MEESHAPATGPHFFCFLSGDLGRAFWSQPFPRKERWLGRIEGWLSEMPCTYCTFDQCLLSCLLSPALLELLLVKNLGIRPEHLHFSAWPHPTSRMDLTLQAGWKEIGSIAGEQGAPSCIPALQPRASVGVVLPLATAEQCASFAGSSGSGEIVHWHMPDNPGEYLTHVYLNLTMFWVPSTVMSYNCHGSPNKTAWLTYSYRNKGSRR